MGLFSKKIHYSLKNSERRHGQTLYIGTVNGMKNKYFLLQALIMTALLWGVLNFAVTARADDIDDIESDMETAISESDAAQSEATAAKTREREEQVNLEKTKNEAQSAMEKAKVKEAEATKEIKKIDARIAVLVAEKKRFEKVKAAAEKRILDVQQKLEVKKTALTEAQGMHKAANDEKKVQEDALAKLEDEKKQVESEIIKNRNETASYNNEIKDLKKKTVDLEARLVQLRQNAMKENAKLEKAKAQRDEQKRRMSSVPSKVTIRTPKVACAVTDEASDGAKSIGKLKVGHKYEIYRVIEKRWVYLQYGKSRGYAARTCF